MEYKTTCEREFDRSQPDWWLGKQKSTYFHHYDRHEQLEVLYAAAFDDALPKDPEEFWQIVGQVWTRTEHPRNQIEAWSTVFGCSPGLNKATQEWIKQPKQLYRGYLHILPDYDWSWTTDKDKAQWFADRYKKAPSLWINPRVKEFDPSTDIHRVMCVIGGSESEVLMWSPTASDRSNYFDEEEFLLDYNVDGFVTP